MFVGHFGVGLGFKSADPKLSLGTLFLAAQFIDLLWPSLLLLGLEHVEIAPGITRVTPLNFTHYPISHSLLAVVGWGLIFALAYYALRRGRSEPLAARPGNPTPRSDALPRRRTISRLWAVEFAVGHPCRRTAHLRFRRPPLPAHNPRPRPHRLPGPVGPARFSNSRIFCQPLCPPPPSVADLAWVGQAQWLLILWGYWIDSHRYATS